MLKLRLYENHLKLISSTIKYDIKLDSFGILLSLKKPNKA